MKFGTVLTKTTLALSVCMFVLCQVGISEFSDVLLSAKGHEDSRLHSRHKILDVKFTDESRMFVLANKIEEKKGQEEIKHSHFQPRLPSIGSKNFLPNSSFELGTDHWSSLGQITGWGGDLSGLFGKIQPEGALDGNHCLRIDMGLGHTLVTHYDGWPPDRRIQHVPLVANLGWAEVKKGAEYTLSSYLRADPPGMKARLVFRHGGQPPDSIREEVKTIVLTGQWRRYTFTRAALEETLCIAVGPDMNDHPEQSATFWVDAIQLEENPHPTPYQPREVVEIGVETGKYGNIFNAKKPVRLKVHASNITLETVTVDLKIQLQDYFDQQLPGESLRLEIPGSQVIPLDWPLKIPGKGFYRARIDWWVNGIGHSRVLKFAVIKPYSFDNSPFGVNHAPTTTEQCELLKWAGVTWARDWSLNWEWIESKPGQITYDDSHIDRLTKAGINVVSLLPPNPSTNWASEAPKDVPAHQWKRLAYAPKSPQQLYAHIDRTVRRFRNRVKVWEFLNEPLWVPNFCLPQSAGYKISDYLSLLQNAYHTMKVADPNCQVVGGLGIQAEFPLGDEFLRAGGLDFVDCYNLHPYAGFRAPEAFIENMKRILAVMDEMGTRKPIWATECGYYSADDRPWKPWFVPKDHHGAEWLLNSERQCANYMVRFSVILLAHGVEKIFWHESTEGPTNNGSWNLGNPLLAEEALPRKSYPALAALANFLGPNPKFTAKMTFPEAVFGLEWDQLYGFAFQCNEQAVGIVWSVEERQVQEEIVLAPGIEAFDLMGNPLSKLSSLGPSSVYLVSKEHLAKKLADSWFN